MASGRTREVLKSVWMSSWRTGTGWVLKDAMGTSANGRAQYTLSNKMLALHKSFIAESPDGKHGFEIKGKFKLMGTYPPTLYYKTPTSSSLPLEPPSSQASLTLAHPQAPNPRSSSTTPATPPT